MDGDYPSFINGSAPNDFDYDPSSLRAGGYKHRARCNSTNPDCQKLIADKNASSSKVKVVELGTKSYGNNMVDVWVI